ncbi:Conserved_hypothetical protein [Hexamita inflata]|uniref:Uncharacterized protein n=1 Tax=Hexamita inflata TaxID=28002 RepID=A0AA86QP28_9EUKA|nr:Conserved hypothetical protein [Hexamita inflata]
MMCLYIAHQKQLNAFQIPENSEYLRLLEATRTKTCTNSKQILNTKINFCIRGNQSNQHINTLVQFSSTQNFNASILFDATRLDRFVYSGQISYSSQMQMFSLVSSGSLRITSSNITVSQLQCPSAALLSSRGALVLNNSAVSFSHSGQASGGLVFESLDMAVFNVAFACSITVQYGGLFAFSASGKLVLDRFSATGAFNVPSPSLVNAGSLLAITIRNASATFFVQNRCGSGSCSMSGLLVAGLDPAFSCGSNAEYCGMRQVLFGDYHQKEIVVDGVAVQARCAVEGVQDFNYSYVRVDESVSGARANSSLFCYRPVFTRMIVSGSYQVAGSGLDFSSGSIFVAKRSVLVKIQQSKIEVNFTTTKFVELSVFLNQEVNIILIENCNITLRLRSDSFQIYFGISKVIQTLNIGNSVINYDAHNINNFYGLAQTLIAATVNLVTISMQVNCYYAYGLAMQCTSNAQISNSVIQGQLNAPVTYGILREAIHTINMINITFGLKTTGSAGNCGFIQVIIQANAVTTSNITFIGFGSTPVIMSTLPASQYCPCMPNSDLINGLCYCYPGASPVNGVCTCPQYAQLISKTCECSVPDTSIVNGACTCGTKNAFIYYNASSSSNVCRCAVNAVNSSNECFCPAGSYQSNGVCVCYTANAFFLNGACTCGQYANNISDSCSCPLGSTLVGGVCKCSIANQIISPSGCSCPTGVCHTRQRFQTRTHTCSGAFYQRSSCCNINELIPECNCTVNDWTETSSCTVPSEVKTTASQRYSFNSPTGSCDQTANPDICAGIKHPPKNCVCLATDCTQLVYDSCRVFTYTSYWQNSGGSCNCVENTSPT